MASPKGIIKRLQSRNKSVAKAGGATSSSDGSTSRMVKNMMGALDDANKLRRTLASGKSAGQKAAARQSFNKSMARRRKSK